MTWTSIATQIVVTAAVCAVQIFFRCAYRLLGTFRVCPAIQQKWRTDDTWMALSLLPLITRSACTLWIFSVDLPKSTEEEVITQKLLIGSRLSYALILWCMKLCLVQFYTRLETGSNKVHRSIQAIRISLIVTYIIIAFATLFECRPPSAFWDPDTVDHPCRKGTRNLVTMAGFNILTDLALILFPIPLLWKMSTLELQTKLQLTVLFLLGTVVVAITITRIPMILSHSVAQESRTLWASIEIVVASIVANASFYYALWKEVVRLFSRPRHRSICLPHYPAPSPQSRILNQSWDSYPTISNLRTSLDDNDPHHVYRNGPHSISLPSLSHAEAGQEYIYPAKGP